MLEKIAKSINENRNISEKKELNSIVEYIEKNSFKSERIFSDFGEDSASIEKDSDLILLTTDRIRTSYIKTYPFGAGFSSILVGVDDIYCCGGRPLAASVTISYENSEIGQKILEGIAEGSNKFQVPIIRGHTNFNGKQYELSSTMIGEIKKENYISATNATIGDKIILAVDFDGKIAKANKNYWDTVTFKSSDEVLRKRSALNVIATKRLANSSKDISMGGIFGTIIQLVTYSYVGALIDVSKILIPEILINNDYSLEDYSRMFLTTSFIITAKSENTKEIITTFEEYGLKATSIGTITKEIGLIISDGIRQIKIPL
jgi:selenophosphate synthetase-related protein